MTNDKPTTPATPARWLELAEKLRLHADWLRSHVAAFVSGDVEREAADVLDSQAAELEKLRAIADAVSALDADTVEVSLIDKTVVLIDKILIDKIQAAWLDWKGAEHD